MEPSMSSTALSKTISYATPKTSVHLTPAPRKLKHRCTCSAAAMLVFTYELFIVVVTPGHHGLVSGHTVLSWLLFIRSRHIRNRGGSELRIPSHA
jgi:hypothetical protein